MTTRDDYVMKLKGQLDRCNAEMTKWESHAKAVQANARKRFDEQLKLVREQREKALYQLELLENASAASWADFSRGTDEALDRMRVAVDKARIHFAARKS